MQQNVIQGRHRVNDYVEEFEQPPTPETSEALAKFRAEEEEKKVANKLAEDERLKAKQILPPKKQARKRREDTKNNFASDFGVNVKRKDKRPPIKGKSYVEEMKLDEMFEKPFEDTEINFCNKVKSCGHECDGV